MKEKFLVATEIIAIGDHIFQPGAIFQIAADDVGNGGYQAEYAPLHEGEPVEKNVEDMEEMLFISGHVVVAASTWVDALRESFTRLPYESSSWSICRGDALRESFTWGDDDEHRGGCETVAEFVEAWK